MYCSCFQVGKSVLYAVLCIKVSNDFPKHFTPATCKKNMKIRARGSVTGGGLMRGNPSQITGGMVVVGWVRGMGGAPYPQHGYGGTYPGYEPHTRKYPRVRTCPYTPVRVGGGVWGWGDKTGNDSHGPPCPSLPLSPKTTTFFSPQDHVKKHQKIYLTPGD